MIEELLPPSLARDENLKALTKALDKEIQKIEKQIPKVLLLPRIDQIEDEELLDLLAWQFHIEGYELARNIEEKRKLIKKAIELHRHKGTPYAIKQVLKALGLEGRVKEWFEYGSEPYKFKIELGTADGEITPQLRDKLLKLIEEYKNTRSHLEEIILYYLAKGNVFISAGSTGEAKAAANQIEGYTWTSQGAPSILAGSVGEVVAWAR